MKLTQNHPRYESLKQREKIVKALKKGIVTEHGLIAHGRGEAFNYLLNEETKPPAKKATKKAVEELNKSKNPVLSVNGNTAALVPKKIAKIDKKTKIKVEVNLFHRTQERIKKIIDYLKENGVSKVLGKNPTKEIPGLEHERGKVSEQGIYKADTVIVPLEDGDRTEKLKEMNKKVIAIDLNPLSRTSKKADITIVDDIDRAISNILKELDHQNASKNTKVLFDNEKNLKKMERYIRSGYN